MMNKNAKKTIKVSQLQKTFLYPIAPLFLA